MRRVWAWSSGLGHGHYGQRGGAGLRDRAGQDQIRALPLLAGGGVRVGQRQRRHRDPLHLLPAAQRRVRPRPDPRQEGLALRHPLRGYDDRRLCLGLAGRLPRAQAGADQRDAGERGGGAAVLLQPGVPQLPADALPVGGGRGRQHPRGLELLRRVPAELPPRRRPQRARQLLDGREPDGGGARLGRHTLAPGLDGPGGVPVQQLEVGAVFSRC